MYIKQAIEVLKQHKSTTDKFNHTVGNVKVSEAIDTVVSYCEKSEKIEFLKSAKQPSEITHPYDLSKNRKQRNEG